MPSARKSSAYFARPVTFATTSWGSKFWPISLYAMSRLPGRTHDASQVVVVGAAPAEIAGHREARLFHRRVRIVVQQRDSGHHLSAGTESALRSELGDECRLHLVQLAVRSLDAFDRGDLAVTHAVRQRRTGIHGDSLDDDGAGAAFAMIAAELRAGQTELVADRVGQRFLRQNVDATAGTVDVQRHQPLDGTRGLRMGGRYAGTAEQIARGRRRRSRCDHALDEGTSR